VKNAFRVVLTTAMIVVGSHALAADQMSSDSDSKMMKECMAKQKAMDSSMSKDAMKKACMAQMKQGSDSSMGAKSTPNQTEPTTKGDPNPSTGSPTTPPK
jgi:uncharacterized protein (DUF2235 family)